MAPWYKVRQEVGHRTVTIGKIKYGTGGNACSKGRMEPTFKKMSTESHADFSLRLTMTTYT